jgi:eukaryotic-like serine/threonine-protein kinase
VKKERRARRHPGLSGLDRVHLVDLTYMPLSVGDRLGPYEVVALIGKGGMGEVYRARDPRLNRDVAIKVSAAQFSERFEREAKAIAALNHPNICQIYDVGPNYLVMEFIEGEAPNGPMPLDEALRIARQIADALEAAHDKGITHRDLKPGNIKIKPDGTVKVLDFGLAKVTAAPSGSGANSPTLTMGMTQAGMILGTASYMAPEQARGKESVDKRADIWAFGVVLYELVRGKQLFQPIEQLLRPLVRLDVDLGPDVSLGSSWGAGEILSPDGTRLVYVSHDRLFTRRLDQPNATEIAGTQGAHAPFFSPDGQWVGFYTGTSVKKISVEGGSAITLSSASIGMGGSWGEDGNIIAAVSTNGGLSRIPSAAGPPTPVTDLQSGEQTHRWPQILPGGKAVLFTVSANAAGFDAANIEVVSLADHRRKTLVRGGTFGRYLPSGHLVYVNRGALFAVPLDVDRLEVHGTPAPVLDQVLYSPTFGSAQLDFSQTGTLIYRSGGVGGGLSIVAWLDGAGKAQPLLAKPGAYGRPSMSPDGQRLAIEVSEGSGTDIWSYDWQRDTMTRLTFTGNAMFPLWSPDGRYIAFLALGEGMSVTRSDGAGKPQPLTQSKDGRPMSFTADGKRLAFNELSSGRIHLWTVPLESDGAGLRAGKPEVFLQTPADERNPSFSPDGRWMAYSSDESGTFQVYVRAFPDKGGKWQISNSGGTYPMWSRNGHELFFQTLDSHIMVAAYTEKGDSLVADKPRVWSEKQIGGVVNNIKGLDLAPDGKRIVALMPVETAEGQKAQSHVIFLMNFSDEVRRKVPVGK